MSKPFAPTGLTIEPVSLAINIKLLRSDYKTTIKNRSLAADY
jgi:hypothetical protein